MKPTLESVIELLEERGHAVDVTSRKDQRWCLIRYHPLGSHPFVLVLKPGYLDLAREQNPGRGVYLLEEARDLFTRARSDDILRKVHETKRRFGGIVLPPGHTFVDLRPVS